VARWRRGGALELVDGEQVSFMVGPPAFFVALLGVPGFATERVRSLRQGSCGGAGGTPGLVRSASGAPGGAWAKRPSGPTEAPPVTPPTLDDDLDRAATTDGCPVGQAELRVV